MDKEDALRIAIFEYLLPLQKRIRYDAISKGLTRAHIFRDWDPNRHPAGIFEDILRFSDRLLAMHGFPTSYVYPWSMHHENGMIDKRLTVAALVDSPGPFVWNPACSRKADPPCGIRTFRAGPYMASGVFAI